MTQQREIKTTEKTTEVARGNLQKPTNTPKQYNKPPEMANSTSTDATSGDAQYTKKA